MIWPILRSALERREHFRSRDMKLPRRQFLRVAAGAAALPALSKIAGAQNYPTRPVHLVVAFVPGGATDTLARQISNDLKEALGQAVVVENRPGANGYLGTTSRRRSRMAIPSCSPKMRWPSAKPCTRRRRRASIRSRNTTRWRR